MGHDSYGTWLTRDMTHMGHDSQEGILALSKTLVHFNTSILAVLT